MGNVTLDENAMTIGTAAARESGDRGGGGDGGPGAGGAGAPAGTG